MEGEMKVRKKGKKRLRMQEGNKRKRKDKNKRRQGSRKQELRSDLIVRCDQWALNMELHRPSPW